MVYLDMYKLVIHFVVYVYHVSLVIKNKIICSLGSGSSQRSSHVIYWTETILHQARMHGDMGNTLRVWNSTVPAVERGVDPLLVERRNRRLCFRLDEDVWIRRAARGTVRCCVRIRDLGQAIPWSHQWAHRSRADQGLATRAAAVFTQDARIQQVNRGGCTKFSDKCLSVM